MTANKHQRIVLGIGLVLVVLNGLFPPFELAYHHQVYRFMFAAPDNSKIIFALFFVQFVTLIAATGGAFFLFGLWGNKLTALAEIEKNSKSLQTDDQPMTQPASPETAILRIKLPDDFEKELQSRVSIFVCREFLDSSPHDRETAEKYIYGKLYFAAQFFYAEHISTNGFDISDHLLKATVRFKELKQTNRDKQPAKPPTGH